MGSSPSPTSDPPFVREQESADASLLPLMENPSSSTGFVEYRDTLKHSYQSHKKFNNKENFSTTKEESLNNSVFSETMHKRSKKAGHCNLRKSLAWNQAFSTEEGVLDPQELSILSKSSMKSKESTISMINVQKSPPMEIQQSNVMYPPNTVKNKIIGKMHAHFGGKNNKNVKAANLLCKLDASVHEEQQEALGAISSNKRIIKGVQASASSQKRIAITNAANPASKIPKFMPTKLHSASPTAPSRDAVAGTRSLKSDRSTTAVNTQQNHDPRCSPLNIRKYSLIPSTSHLCRPWVPLMDTCVGGFNLTSESSTSKAVHGSTPVSLKGSSLLPKKAYHVAGESVAPAHGKPSALRMPSPSLRFFQQGKLPQCGSRLQRNVLAFRPNIPLVKGVSEDQADESRLLPASAAQKSTRRSATPESFGVILSSKEENSLMATALPSFNDNVVHPSATDTISTMHVNMINIGASREFSSNVSTEQVLLGHKDNEKQSRLVKEAPCVSDSLLQMDNDTSINGNIGLAKESLEINVYKDDHHPCAVTRKNSATESEYSYQVCYRRKLNETNIDRDAPEADNLTKVSPPSEYAGFVPDTVSQQDGQITSNLYLFPDTEVHLENVVDSFALPITKSPLFLNKEKMAGSAFIKSSEAGNSLPQETYIENDFQINLVRNVPTEENTRSLISSVEPRVDSCFISISEMDSVSQKTSMPAEKANSSINRCVVLTNSSQDSHPIKLDGSAMQFSEKDLSHTKKEGSLLLEGGKNERMQTANQDIGHLKHHINAIPFSEEWLAAIENFGEEILEMKTGPVQNSPPEKSLPEPGPWSPGKYEHRSWHFDGQYFEYRANGLSWNTTIASRASTCCL